MLLELGYFMGKIERKRVCVLYEEGVELPSDYYTETIDAPRQLASLTLLSLRPVAPPS